MNNSILLVDPDGEEVKPTNEAAYRAKDEVVANGVIGITINPGGENDSRGDGKGSTNGNIIIMINNQANEKDQARTTAHEGYGHALFLSEGKIKP